MVHTEKELRKERELELLRKFGALPISQIQKKLNEKFDYHLNTRTIQRDIMDLIKERKVVPNPPIGREQTYRVREKTVISSYLLSRFWREEEEIEKENVYGIPSRAYEKARFLVIKFPEGLQKKLLPVFEKVKLGLLPRSLEDPYNTRIRCEKYLKYEGIPLIIGKISEVLNQMAKEGSVTEP